MTRFLLWSGHKREDNSWCQVSGCDGHSRRCQSDSTATRCSCGTPASQGESCHCCACGSQVPVKIHTGHRVRQVRHRGLRLMADKRSIFIQRIFCDPVIILPFSIWNTLHTPKSHRCHSYQPATTTAFHFSSSSHKGIRKRTTSQDTSNAKSQFIALPFGNSLSGKNFKGKRSALVNNDEQTSLAALSREPFRGSSPFK